MTNRDLANRLDRLNREAYSLLDIVRARKMRRADPLEAVKDQLRKQFDSTLETAKDAILCHHYRNVSPSEECRIVEEAARDYLEEQGMDLGPVSFVEPCDSKGEADFSIDEPARGFYDNEADSLCVVTATAAEMVGVLLHEFMHRQQKRWYGEAKHERGTEQLESQANRFARMHEQNVKWRVCCRMPQAA